MSRSRVFGPEDQVSLVAALVTAVPAQKDNEKGLLENVDQLASVLRLYFDSKGTYYSAIRKSQDGKGLFVEGDDVTARLISAALNRKFA